MIAAVWTRMAQRRRATNWVQHNLVEINRRDSKRKVRNVFADKVGWVKGNWVEMRENSYVNSAEKTTQFLRPIGLGPFEELSGANGPKLRTNKLFKFKDVTKKRSSKKPAFPPFMWFFFFWRKFCTACQLIPRSSSKLKWQKPPKNLFTKNCWNKVALLQFFPIDVSVIVFYEMFQLNPAFYIVFLGKRLMELLGNLSVEIGCNNWRPLVSRELSS